MSSHELSDVPVAILDAGVGYRQVKPCLGLYMATDLNSGLQAFIHWASLSISFIAFEFYLFFFPPGVCFSITRCYFCPYKILILLVYRFLAFSKLSIIVLKTEFYYTDFYFLLLLCWASWGPHKHSPGSCLHPQTLSSLSASGDAL